MGAATVILAGISFVKQGGMNGLTVVSIIRACANSTSLISSIRARAIRLGRIGGSAGTLLSILMTCLAGADFLGLDFCFVADLAPSSSGLTSIGINARSLVMTLVKSRIPSSASNTLLLRLTAR